MHKYSVEEGLRKNLESLYKKDRVTYEALIKKMEDILNTDAEHYKNLRAPLQDFKRVHVRGPFVLIFKYVKDEISFYELDHHDRIYKSGAFGK